MRKNIKLPPRHRRADDTIEFEHIQRTDAHQPRYFPLLSNKEMPQGVDLSKWNDTAVEQENNNSMQ